MVTVYTKFGYANVDLNRYERELEALPHSPESSPEKKIESQAESKMRHLKAIIEVHFRYPPKSIGYIQVSKHHAHPYTLAIATRDQE